MSVFVSSLNKKGKVTEFKFCNDRIITKMSEEIAEIIKQAVKESTKVVHTKCNDGKINTGGTHV